MLRLAGWGRCERGGGRPRPAGGALHHSIRPVSAGPCSSSPLVPRSHLLPPPSSPSAFAPRPLPPPRSQSGREAGLGEVGVSCVHCGSTRRGCGASPGLPAQATGLAWGSSSARGAKKERVAVLDLCAQWPRVALRTGNGARDRDVGVFPVEAVPEAVGVEGTGLRVETGCSEGPGAGGGAGGGAGPRRRRLGVGGSGTGRAALGPQGCAGSFLPFAPQAPGTDLFHFWQVQDLRLQPPYLMGCT